MVLEAQKTVPAIRERSSPVMSDDANPRTDSVLCLTNLNWLEIPCVFPKNWNCGKNPKISLPSPGFSDCEAPRRPWDLQDFGKRSQKCRRSAALWSNFLWLGLTFNFSWKGTRTQWLLGWVREKGGITYPPLIPVLFSHSLAEKAGKREVFLLPSFGNMSPFLSIPISNICSSGCSLFLVP